MFKRIDHVEIIPADTERAIEFYSKVLGFTMKSRTKIGMGSLEEVIFLSLGDSTLKDSSMKDPTPPSKGGVIAGYRMMAIEVDDMDQAVAYLKGKGVEVSMGPVALADGSKRAESKPLTALESSSDSGSGSGSLGALPVVSDRPVTPAESPERRGWMAAEPE